MRYSVLLILLLGWSLRIFSQTTISDCNGAIVLCGDLYTEETSTATGGTLLEWTGTCNAGAEVYSVWYTFTVQSDGELSFILTPEDANADYDWGLFDITEGGCAAISLQDGTSPEVSCNSYGVIGVNGPTGISTLQGGISNSGGPGNLNGPPFNADLPVLTGQVYALVVMNWSQSDAGYTIDFAESTASLYDDQPPVLQAAISNCANTEMTLTFSEPIVISSVINFDFTITGPGGTFGITAASPGEPGAAQDDVIIINIDGQIVTPGIYTIDISDENGFVEDACGNLATESIEIELFAPLTFTAITTTACNGENGVIEITSITGGDEPYTILVGGEFEPDNVYENIDAGTYTISIVDESNCALNDNITVLNHTISVTIPAIQDSLSCINPSAIIQGLLVAPQQEVTYAWSFFEGIGNISSGANGPTPEVTQPGYYIVTVIDSEFGCQASAGVEIAAGEVYGVDLSSIIIPNVMTPNGDSKNERWAPLLVSNPDLDLSLVFDEYELKIFNRWGTLIHESSGSSIFWTVKDESEGTYFYTLHYSTNCGGKQEADLEGTITILR